MSYASPFIGDLNVPLLLEVQRFNCLTSKKTDFLQHVYSYSLSSNDISLTSLRGAQHIPHGMSTQVIGESPQNPLSVLGHDVERQAETTVSKARW